jgi:hypothetical protein
MARASCDVDISTYIMCFGQPLYVKEPSTERDLESLFGWLPRDEFYLQARLQVRPSRVLRFLSPLPP